MSARILSVSNPNPCNSRVVTFSRKNKALAAREKISSICPTALTKAAVCIVKAVNQQIDPAMLDASGQLCGKSPVVQDVPTGFRFMPTEAFSDSSLQTVNIETESENHHGFICEPPSKLTLLGFSK